LDYFEYIITLGLAEAKEAISPPTLEQEFDAGGLTDLNRIVFLIT
jgi:hypothetical protein